MKSNLDRNLLKILLKLSHHILLKFSLLVFFSATNMHFAVIGSVHHIIFKVSSLISFLVTKIQ